MAVVQGTLKRVKAEGYLAVPQPILKLESLSEANPSKKQRSGILSDGDESLRAIFAAQPSELFAGEVSAGRVLRLLDYTTAEVKGDTAIMVTRMEIASPTDEIMTETGKDEAAPAKEEDVKEEAEEGQPTKKARVMEESTNNAVSASPATASKPKASPLPGNKPKSSPTTKENTSPSSAVKKIPVSTPGSTPGSRRVVPIQSLNPYNETWTIKAKVMSKSVVRTFNSRNGEGKVASMDIVDEQGTSIGVTMWSDFVGRHYEGIEEGKVYFFTRGSIKPANKKYASTRNDYEIHFDGRTTIEESADQNASNMVAKLEFVPIDQLAGHVGKKLPVDVLGVVVQCGEEGTVKRKSDDTELRRANITLLDASLKTVECTLWNDNVDYIRQLSGLDTPVVSVSTVRVSDFQGVSLSTVSRSVIDINPSSEEAQKLRTWYDTEGRNATTTAAGEGLVTPGKSQSANKREDLRTIQPTVLPSPDEKAAYHNAILTVAIIFPDQSFYYMAHPETNRKVVEQNGAYYCEYDGKTCQTMRRRYVMQAKVTDHTGEATVSIFNDQAERLLGLTADELAVLKEDGSEEATAKKEAILKKACWTEWQTRVMTKSREYNGDVKLRINVQDLAPVDYAKESGLLLQRIQALKA